MPTSDRQQGRWPLTIAAVTGITFARAAIIAAIGVGMGYAAFNAVVFLRAAPDPGPAGLLATLSSIAVFAAALWLARRREPLPPWSFVLIALLGGTLLRVLYFALVEPVWVSDFARYWRIANEMADADHYVVRTIYEQRALPYLVPLAEIFGKVPAALKLANIAVLGLVQVAGYDVLRRCHGHHAAQCFTLLWIGAPEPLFSLTIPTHDLVAMGMLAGIVWLLTLAVHPTNTAANKRGRGRAWLLATPLVAFLLVLLEVQRGIGLIALASLVAVAVAGVLVSRRFPHVLRESASQTMRLLIITLLCVPLYGAGIWGATKSGLTMPEQAARVSVLRYTTAHVSSLSDGSYAWFLPFHTAFTSNYAEDPERLEDLRNSLALSDFIEDPVARLDNASHRLRNLYRLGGSRYFYMAGFADQAPMAVRTLQRYNDTYALGFALLVLLSVGVLMSRPGLSLLGAGFLLVLGSAVTIVLTLVAENQPRYLYLIWFVGAMAVAAGLARAASGSDTPIAARRMALRMGGALLQTVLIIVGGTAMIWLVAHASYVEASGRMLSHWELTADPALSSSELSAWRESLRDPPSDVLLTAGTRYRPKPRSFGPLALTLALPSNPEEGDQVRASRRVCTSENGRDDLSFFVYTPYKKLSRSGAFELQVAVNGRVSWRLALPHAKQPAPFEIRNVLPRGRCSELTFILLSNVTQDRASWRRASRVEIYFPRLVDAHP